MARFGSSAAFLLVGGYDLTGYAMNIKDAGCESVVEDTTVLGDTWQQYLPVGVRKAGLSFDAFYDDDLGDGSEGNTLNAGTVEAIIGQENTNRAIAWGVAGKTVGAWAVLETGGFTAKYGRIATRSELVKLAVDISLSNVLSGAAGARQEGRILEGLTARTSAFTDGASVDWGATWGAPPVAMPSAAGAYGHLHVPTLVLGGYTSVTIKIQDSANNTDWADLITFTNVTAKNASELKFQAGNVDRYTRVTVTWNGTGADEAIKFFVGMHRA